MNIRISLFIIALFGISCSKEKLVPTYYHAVQKDQEAVLTLTLNGKRFHGIYELRYLSTVKDSGEVRGEIVGDTLKGKFDYRSYGGSKVWAPFIALNQNGSYRVATGVKTTLMNIPLYIPETISFGEENLLLQPISKEKAEELGMNPNGLN